MGTKTAGMQLSRIGEQLPCTREPGTRKDPFAVAVVRSSVNTVSQLQTIECARTSTGLIARGGGRIRLGVANQNQSVNIISAKFCKRPLRENFVPQIIWCYNPFADHFVGG